MQKTSPREFIALIAMLTATIAMSIDTMLPALGIMATELGATNPNDRQLIILGFFGGLMFGTLIFGPWSDSIGRKPAIYIGTAFFVAGGLVCMVSDSMPMIIAGRVLQGFGAAGPRTVSFAMIRDGTKGAEMARIMSFVMAVFMLVPILAPSIGMLILKFAGWRMIFAGLIAMVLLVTLWLWLRQEETLPLERRQKFTFARLGQSAVEVMRHPVSIGYTIAVGFIFAAFTSYLGTAQQIFGEQYGQGDYFALWFGGLSVGIAASMIFNGRNVKHYGMRKLSRYALAIFIINWVVMLLLCLIYAGHPPLWMTGAIFLISFFMNGMTFGNYNAMAMEPMGHIAGMAAAVTGFLSSLIGTVLGGIAGQLYDGTMYPLTISFVLFGICAWIAAEWTEKNRLPVSAEGEKNAH